MNPGIFIRLKERLLQSLTLPKLCLIQSSAQLHILLLIVLPPPQR